MAKDIENILKNPSSYSEFSPPKPSKDPNLHYNDVTMNYFSKLKKFKPSKPLFNKKKEMTIFCFTK